MTILLLQYLTLPRLVLSVCFELLMPCGRSGEQWKLLLAITGAADCRISTDVAASCRHCV